ncbi:MAG: flavin reductase family protein [Oscillospiraceae bacterium]|nr:flavin reductase family protein [Oscillospiraceae bacterium]
MGNEKIYWNGGAMLAPLPPVLVTCGTMEQPNVLTVAWTGICCTHPPMTYISVRPSRHSYSIIKESGEFAINLPTTALVKAVDFCGVRSGKNTDKFKECGLHLIMPQKGNVPILEESPVSLSCKVVQVIPLGTHDMFIAEIIETAADARYVDSKGKLNLQQSGLLAYAHGEYFALGRKCGSFGYSVQKKNSRRKKHKPSPTKD